VDDEELNEKPAELPERESTRPPGRPKEPAVLKQTPIRMHVHDHAVLMGLLRQDGMNLQRFMGYCVRAYLDAHPYMLKVLRDMRELDMVPKDVQDKHVLSMRERMSLFDEIEKSSGKDEK
jgi:hypothetical protein